MNGGCIARVERSSDSTPSRQATVCNERLALPSELTRLWLHQQARIVHDCWRSYGRRECTTPCAHSLA
eukprot:COSAG01_NODE_29428_length_637_cov_110.111524_1_plen_67_part_01